MNATIQPNRKRSSKLNAVNTDKYAPISYSDFASMISAHGTLIEQRGNGQYFLDGVQNALIVKQDNSFFVRIAA